MRAICFENMRTIRVGVAFLIWKSIMRAICFEKIVSQQGKKGGREEGRKEGRKGGREEGRKGGMKE